MAWQKRDRNIMFAVNYEDGRLAYITIDPDSIRSGDHLARAVARERQDRGEIPIGEIATVKRSVEVVGRNG
jgi:hypothetical protein